ncbi:uncharacterized protein Dwil_GK27208 [Drosophila willistoni]|nr:uncharacterized protein Dwil_GK27208 [Drosophila willistoni]
MKPRHILHNCCNGPVYSLELYKDVCAEYMPEGIPKVSPCLHECVYNASNILIGDQMNLDNVEYIIHSCCTSPKVTIDAFKDACGKYMPEGIPKVSACLHECIYNASNILNNNQVNLVNVRKMIQQALGTDSDFTDVLVEGIGNCSGSINDMKKTMKRRPRPLAGMEVCSPLPMMISVCAQRYVTTHCPESQWIPTVTCENARQCEMLG